jgi:CP family cyanate transporter-like MFS transporter
MEDFGLDRGVVSFLVACVTIMMAIVMLPASMMLAPKIGLKRSLALGCLLMSSGILTPLNSSFVGLLLLRISFGFGAGVVLPMTSAIVMQWFSPKELPLINGVNVAAQSVGVAISMFLAVPIGIVLGWQWVFCIFGGVTCCGFLLWVLVGRENASASDATEISTRGVLFDVVRQRSTILLQLAVAGMFAAYVAFSTWLPGFFNEVHGLSLNHASNIVAVLPIVGIFSTIFGGILSAKVGLRRPFLIFPGIIFAVASLGVVFFDYLPLIYLSVIVMGIAGWIYLPSIFTIPMELGGMTAEKVGVMTAATLAVGNFASFLSPILVGFTVDLFGSYSPAFTFLAIGSLTVVIAGVLLPETGPKGSPRADKKM